MTPSTQPVTPAHCASLFWVAIRARSLRGLWSVCLSVFLGACASAPQVADKSTSRFDDLAPAASPLVALATSQPDSGIRLLADPSEALQSRLHLSALATATLDIQYYLWQGDDSGLGLTHEVLQAADRGVRVRILLDDIYHSGRDSAYQTLDAHPNVEVRLFNPMGNRGAAKQTNYAFKKSTLNYRMHNKIFLVDGVAAVLGGRNIGNEYFGQDPSFNFQDMDAIALGEVAAEAGMSSSIFRVDIGSSDEAGSSRSSTDGLMAMALAMTSRCCCPPDSARAGSLSRFFTSSHKAALLRAHSTCSSISTLER